MTSKMTAAQPIEQTDETYEQLIAAIDDSGDDVFYPAFDAVVEHVAQTQALPIPEAQIVVCRELARRASLANATAAKVHLLRAQSIARQYQQLGPLLDIQWELTQSHLQSGDRYPALQAVTVAWQLVQEVPADPRFTDIGLTLAQLQRRVAADPVDEIYDVLLARPGSDALRIAIHRARASNSLPGPERIADWQQVLELAIASGRTAETAAAHLELGEVYHYENKTELALESFRQAQQIKPVETWSAFALRSFASSLEAQQERAEAIETLQQALRAEPDPASRVMLLETLAPLSHATGHTDEAYAALLEVNRLRQRRDFVPLNLDFGSKVAAIDITDPDQAAALAAIRNELREAELDRTHLRQRQALGIAALALFATALLGLGYAYKRRAAALAALGRDAAEVRAENAHLLALHYQLNPHFLFNALNSLRSRIFVDQNQAAGLLDRLTAFCRQTLTSRPEGLETIGDECAMLQDYLAIEQSRWRDNLQVQLDFDPAISDRLLPSFLLLPLIENALKYGAETSEEQIGISISIRHQESDTIVATITNSGTWIVPGTANRRTSTRVGLANLRERLARFYPDRHTLAVGADPAGGVTARLELRGEPVTLSTD